MSIFPSQAEVDDLSITLKRPQQGGQQTISGWQEVQLTRSLRSFPSTFDLSFTESYPHAKSDISVQPGDEVSIKIGQDVVLTGYVDRYVAQIGSETHNIRIQGRSKCEDLFDCSTDVPMLEAGTTPLKYAQQLSKPFNITVSQLGKGNGKVYPGLSGNRTESPYRLIETVARYSALLVYDDVDGNLVLADVNVSKMKSGFYQGKNVQNASVTFSMDQRFSDYQEVITPIGIALAETGNRGGGGDLNTVGKAKDKGVPRHRILISVCPPLLLDGKIGDEMAAWEMNRRWGQSNAVTLTCDSWRETPQGDSSGKLWQPNFSAPVVIPALKIPENDNREWVIADVVFKRSLQSGTTAQITLMPAAAFSVEPVTPIDLWIQEALSRANTK
jgi:prophage tail gpP-like protein